MEASNKATPLDTSALPTKGETINYNIVEDLKRPCASISIFELEKIKGRCELLIQTFSQTSLGDKDSTSQQVSSKSFGSLEYVVNVVTLDANTLYPPFLLTFENFNYNVHNCLVDSGASVNIMPLSVAKKINAKWDKIDAQII